MKVEGKKQMLKINTRKKKKDVRYIRWGGGLKRGREVIRNMTTRKAITSWKEMIKERKKKT